MICDMKTAPSEWRVVLDTNVLVAAARSHAGSAAALLMALADGRYRPMVSVPLLLEYESVLKRPEHLAGRSLAQVDALLDDVCAMARPVHIDVLWRPQTHDESDNMVLETALNGGADGLVTFNVRDFTVAASRFHLPVWRPDEFLQRLQQERSHG